MSAETIKPPFAYYGGKTMLAKRIVPLLPPHKHYVEPFAGSLAVLLAKPRADHETVNDLDQDLMTFWRVLREQPNELAALAALTPHSREEHQAAYALDGCSDIERARRVWVMLSQGRGGMMRRTGWRFYRNAQVTNSSMPDYLTAYADRMPVCARRLHGVSLECRDALDVIRDYGQHPTTLLYCDPPYVGSTRGWGNNYVHEMRTDDAHRALADALHQVKAAVVLSGYPSALYDELYGDWARTDLAAWTGNGLRNGAGQAQGRRTEVLWSNVALSGEIRLDSDVPA